MDHRDNDELADSAPSPPDSEVVRTRLRITLQNEGLKKIVDPLSEFNPYTFIKIQEFMYDDNITIRLFQ